MFNLEEKIAEWRVQMLAAGIKAPVPLEELENHLREAIERQMQSGLNAPQAFEITVKKLGQSKQLKKEFSKVADNPFGLTGGDSWRLKFLAAWFVIFGFNDVAPSGTGLSYAFHSGNFNDFGFNLMMILVGTLQILIGTGLFLRNNLCRVCALAWSLILSIGFSHTFLRIYGQPLFYWPSFVPDPRVSSIQISSSGQLIFYFMGLSAPSELFYFIPFLNLGVLLWGCYVLRKQSVRNLFHPALGD